MNINGNGVKLTYATLLQLIVVVVAVGVGWGVNRSEIKHLKIELEKCCHSHE